MVRVTVLGSGSRGNAILIDGSQGAVLVDCGFAARSLHKRLVAASRRPEEIEAVLLTHEHVDHACGLSAATGKWKWPVHSSAATLAAVGDALDETRTTVALADASHRVGGFLVDHLSVPHDAADCRAYVLTDASSGARVGVVLDCGGVPDGLPAFLSDCDVLVLESNHCPTMLSNGPYPLSLKQRIRGGSGHLSNVQAGAVLSEVAKRGLRGVVLAHLSETNNSPAVAVANARAALRHAGWYSDHVFAAPQREPGASIGPGREVVRPAVQLGLF